MPSLKELRTRMESVKSTKKITSAMKMIAAAKLRKAQELVEANRPYSDLTAQMLGSLLDKAQSFKTPPTLLLGHGRFEKYLYILITSDRGLCGAFNGGVTRSLVKELDEKIHNNNEIKIICVGRKGKEILPTKYTPYIIEVLPSYAKPVYEDARVLGEKILKMFEAEEIDVCKVFYNRFESVLSQVVQNHQLIPFAPLNIREEKTHQQAEMLKLTDLYEYEPGEEEVFNALLPKNVKVQIYQALLETSASEHGARMTAMDGATRNANDMIKNLQLTYNRTRQAYITKELIEIVSGAEALD